jgi:hypothetical protein
MFDGPRSFDKYDGQDSYKITILERRKRQDSFITTPSELDLETMIMMLRMFLMCHMSHVPLLMTHIQVISTFLLPFDMP